MTDSPDEHGATTVGGVLLAAGRSTRFEGGNKLLEPLEGAPVVVRAAATATGANLDGLVAVVGHRAEDVADALAPFEFPVRHNDDYAGGQSTSVREGVAFAREHGWDAAVFLLGDMPFVRPGTVDRLVAAYERGEGTIVAPRYEGERGNPVLFDGEHFDVLAGVTGDRGGRDLVVEHDGTRFVDVADPGVHQDVDTRSDLEAYTE